MGISLNRFKNEYIGRMNLIVWKAARWMQFREYEWDEESDYITLRFKTSSYGIGFEITMKAFSSIYGEPYFTFDEAYEYFKKVKYNECTPINN